MGLKMHREIAFATPMLKPSEVIGIDIQPGMIKRLKERAKAANITNLTARLGDATQPGKAKIRQLR